MMINISRAYNAIGDFDKAYENELDIKYVQKLLDEKRIRFLSQEFQFNTGYGKTLVHKGMTDDAEKVLTDAFENENISSDTDKFYDSVAKAEADLALEKYEEILGM